MNIQSLYQQLLQDERWKQPRKSWALTYYVNKDQILQKYTEFSADAQGGP